MTILLDERIDQHHNVDWTNGHRVALAPFHGAQYQGIANTIVLLIRHCAPGSNRFIAADSVLDAGTLRSTSSQIFEERMAKTCRKRPGNHTRNTDSLRRRATCPTASTRSRSSVKNH